MLSKMEKKEQEEMNLKALERSISLRGIQGDLARTLDNDTAHSDTRSTVKTVQAILNKSDEG
ncbi:MAG: hypothetical protein AAF518_25490, partial [Spirochaetota bacterium]